MILLCIIVVWSALQIIAIVFDVKMDWMGKVFYFMDFIYRRKALKTKELGTEKGYMEKTGLKFLFKHLIENQAFVGEDILN